MLSEKSIKEVLKKFLKELTTQEKFIFLNKVNEEIHQNGYLADENLFYYCYFLTLKERFRAITPYRTDGFLRYIFAEGLKEVEDSIRFYKARLKKRELAVSQDFLEIEE
ncbi:MAG: hypothetical protein NZ809_01580 [Thermodesulfovibrio sp.]|nr:hypothetical protein [Thermodesulfovibrio sp.]